MIRRAAGQLPVALALTGAVIAAPAVVAAQDAPPRRPHRRRRLVPRRGGAGARRQGVHDHGQRDAARGDCRRARGGAGQRPDALRRDRRDERVSRRGSVRCARRRRRSRIAWRPAIGSASCCCRRRGRRCRPPTTRRRSSKALAGITGRRPNDFGNFSMGVGEALAISESDTFALTQVADRDCRMPEAAAAGRRLAGGAGQQGRAEPAPHLHPDHRQERRGDDPARPRLRRRGLPRAGRPRGLAAGDARPQDDRPGQRRLRDRARRRRLRRAGDPGRALGRRRRRGARRAGRRSELAPAGAGQHHQRAPQPDAPADSSWPRRRSAPPTAPSAAARSRSIG